MLAVDLPDMPPGVLFQWEQTAKPQRSMDQCAHSHLEWAEGHGGDVRGRGRTLHEREPAPEVVTGLAPGNDRCMERVTTRTRQLGLMPPSLLRTGCFSASTCKTSPHLEHSNHRPHRNHPRLTLRSGRGLFRVSGRTSRLPVAWDSSRVG